MSLSSAFIHIPPVQTVMSQPLRQSSSHIYFYFQTFTQVTWSICSLPTLAQLNARYFKIISCISLTAACLKLVVSSVQLFPALLISQADWKIMAPLPPGSGKSWDLSCRFHSWLFSKEVRACVFLSAFAKVCGIFGLLLFLPCVGRCASR